MRSRQLKEKMVKRAKAIRRDSEISAFIEKKRNEEHINYGLGYNNLFMQLNSQAKMIKYWRVIREDMGKLLQSVIYCIFLFVNNHYWTGWGQPLVIDLSFMKEMSVSFGKSLVIRELLPVIKQNMLKKEPFQLFITSFDSQCEHCQVN